MYKEAWRKIKEADRIVLLSHIYPDGDTIGSILALFWVLKNSGKRVTLFNATKSELPLEFKFLDGFSKIQDKLPNNFDLLISCDCSSFDRLGIEGGDFELVNIDHHKSNQKFGSINLVEPNFSSTGLVIYRLFEENRVKIPKNSAYALYTSIVDDTGFFSYGGVDSFAFKTASKLIDLGVSPEYIARKIRGNEPLCRVRLRAYMLSSFDLRFDASVAVISFSKEVLKSVGATRKDSKNIIHELLNIANVKIAVMLLETDEYIKVSLRSDENYDVSKISELYGGGGHKRAAGFEVASKEMKDVETEILNLLSTKVLNVE